MLKDILENCHYVFEEGFSDWREAIRASYRPLLSDGTVNETYVSSVIQCVEKFGPYIIIREDVAMPHSSEGAEGCKGTAVSFMRVKTPVYFGTNDEGEKKEARLFFSLSAKDHDAHVKNIQSLMEILVNEELISALLEVENAEMLQKVVEKYN